MKLIIDIDKNDYEKICKTVMTVEDLFETTKGRVYRKIANGIPLEDIKTEIESNAYEGYDFGIQGMILDLDSVLQILDKHIKENKQ